MDAPIRPLTAHKLHKKNSHWKSMMRNHHIFLSDEKREEGGAQHHLFAGGGTAEDEMGAFQLEISDLSKLTPRIQSPQGNGEVWL
ncbi:UNVERIFIED_CONTAM: hypothetical protein Sangu_1089500 [Sesamum angustifolium]|uniref:Uncharacterized protein n=1 Tax=Sesamum angustifolium TaxID=2727405 RepID=A0AAW2NXH5_9LAMI